MLRTTLLGGLALALAVGSSASAAPGAAVGAAPARAFSLQQGAGFDRLEVQLVQRRGSVGVSSGPAAATGSAGWSACVFGWTSSSFFSDCSEPVALTSTVGDGSATGRLRFELRDDFWGDTASVDLTLQDDGQVPTVAVGAQPYADQLRVSSAPYAAVVRTASVSGSVVVTTKRGQKRAVKRYGITAGSRLSLREAVAAAGGAGL